MMNATVVAFTSKFIEMNSNGWHNMKIYCVLAITSFGS